MSSVDYWKKQKEKAEFWEPLQAQFEAEILSHPFIEGLRGKYSKHSVDSIARYIATKKVNAGINGPDYEKRLENLKLQFLEYAQHLLGMILQKKLFNLQLEWRAGRITLPNIVVSYDFNIVGQDIFNCSFLEPITPAELNLMRLYMTTNNFDSQSGFFGNGWWQDYDDYMDMDEDGDRDMPDFFEFYDGHMGTSYLLHYPNERGEKEQNYIVANNRAEAEESAKQKVDNDLPQSKPYLWMDDELDRQVFAETETAEFMRQYDLQAIPDNEAWDMYYDVVEELKQVTDEKIYLSTHLPWDEALNKAWDDYKLRKAAEVLDLAYEQYCMKAGLGMFNTARIEKNLEQSWYREMILKGRAALGEPENFDY